MSKDKVTTEELALMVKKGFDETAKQRDLDLLKLNVEDIKERIENIEKILLKQYGFQIQELQKRMKRVEDLFALK